MVLEKFNQIESTNCMTVKLEDLVSDELEIKRVLNFLGLDYDPIYLEYLKTPRNVFHPLDYQIPAKHQESFQKFVSQ